MFISVTSIHPSRPYFAWKVTSMGKNYVTGKTLLKKRCNQDLELEGATCTAKLTLKESLEGQRREDYVAAGICSEVRLLSLTPAKVKNQLAPTASE